MQDFNRQVSRLGLGEAGLQQLLQELFLSGLPIGLRQIVEQSRPEMGPPVDEPRGDRECCCESTANLQPGEGCLGKLSRVRQARRGFGPGTAKQAEPLQQRPWCWLGWSQRFHLLRPLQEAGTRDKVLPETEGPTGWAFKVKKLTGCSPSQGGSPADVHHEEWVSNLESKAWPVTSFWTPELRRTLSASSFWQSMASPIIPSPLQTLLRLAMALLEKSQAS